MLVRPLSYEDRLRLEAKARKQRMQPKPKADEPQVSDGDIVVKCVFYRPPTKSMIENEPKEHVIRWEKYLAANKERNAPRRLAKVICVCMGFDWDEIIGPRRYKRLALAREEITIAVKKEFPRLSSVQIGKILNKDHTSVLYYLGRINNKKRNVEAWHARRKEQAEREKAQHQHLQGSA